MDIAKKIWTTKLRILNFCCSLKFLQKLGNYFVKSFRGHRFIFVNRVRECSDDADHPCQRKVKNEF